MKAPSDERNLILKSTFSGLGSTTSFTVRVYLHLVSCCCLPNLRNPAKFSENSNLQQFKVIQSHIDLGANRKCICNFLLDININFEWISCRLRDIDAPHPCSTPPSGGKPCNINVIYTPLKNTFNGLQFCRWRYGSILIHSFNRCWLPNLRNPAKFLENSNL